MSVSPARTYVRQVRGATVDRLSGPLARKVTTAGEAAALIRPGDRVGMSGFTGAGHPKAVPDALARRIRAAHAAGEPFTVGVLSGAATAPGLVGALAEADGLNLLVPYQSDAVTRGRINAGSIDYLDVHLSHVSQLVVAGVLGPLDVAVVEIAGVTSDGALVPSTSVGNNATWLEQADRVILEVNSHVPADLLGMHDIVGSLGLPPHRRPLLINHPADRIGRPTFDCPLDRVVAVVPTDAADHPIAFKPPGAEAAQIAGHLLDFFAAEVAAERLPASLLPLQSGVGNVPNAVLSGLGSGPFHGLTGYTEVLQDGMLDLLLSGRMSFVSATAFTLSADGMTELEANLPFLRDRILLRPQEVSNHPEVIRRLGCLAMNGMIEADIFGNVNSTHVMGSSMQNGIGGSGDFARNSYVSIFVTPSTAKGGALSCIVPMASHVDHTEHDVQVLVTEQGLADLRGLSPRRRAQRIIDRCAHPAYRPQLQDYLDRALATAPGKHTPHLLAEALSWHRSYLDTGAMPTG
jgi:succinyl-CoA:acetate CoA-transferase